MYTINTQINLVEFGLDPDLDQISNDTIVAQIRELSKSPCKKAKAQHEELEFEDVLNNIENHYDDRTPDATDIYLKEIGAAPLLTKDEEVYFARLVQKGDANAKKRMIESNLRLVVKIARRYLRSGMPILDLIEEGNIGLIRAVEKFDPELGFRFSTYSAWWIQQTIERAIMSQNRTIRLPVHVVKHLNSCLRVSRELAIELDHEQTAEEIAKRLNKSTTEIEKTLSLNERIISIDMPISDDISRPLSDTIGSNALDPARVEISNNLKKNISHWLDKLTDMQRAVVERRFGLNQYEPTTLEQTGQEIGLTRERVRQLQSEALKSLKIIIESRGEDFDTLVS